MDFFKGDRVIHPNKLEWDIGQILEDSSGNKVRVYFVSGGERHLSLKHVKLKRVPTEPHPILDNLAVELTDKKKSVKNFEYKGLGFYIAEFLKNYPGGFAGKKYLEEERNYKWEAHQLMSELLPKDTFASILSDHNHLEICERAGRVVNKTNLIFPNEKMSLRDGLKIPANQKLFSERLYGLLYGQESSESRFDDFAQCLREMDADKWTTQTYFLFMSAPKEFMFMKPEVTKQAARACGFELNYKSNLNWLTYKLLIDLSNYLLGKLSDLNPKDMIDIQSFIWCSGEAAK